MIATSLLTFIDKLAFLSFVIIFAAWLVGGAGTAAQNSALREDFPAPV